MSYISKQSPNPNAGSRHHAFGTFGLRETDKPPCHYARCLCGWIGKPAKDALAAGRSAVRHMSRMGGGSA